MNPLAVWDARERSWMQPERPERTAWLESRGLPVNQMYRVEFYLVDAPFARLFCYRLSDDGCKHYDDRHLPGQPHDHDSCAAAVEPPQDVILDELPPPRLLEMRR